MRPSANDGPIAAAALVPPGRDLAVAAEALYLLNLLFLPVIAFALLVWLHRRYMSSAPPLAACHLGQTLCASIFAGIILVGINGILFLVGQPDNPFTWVVVLLYFTIGHSTLLVLGGVGLARAIAGKCFRYPLVGRRCRCG